MTYINKRTEYVFQMDGDFLILEHKQWGKSNLWYSETWHSEIVCVISSGSKWQDASVRKESPMVACRFTDPQKALEYVCKYYLDQYTNVREVRTNQQLIIQELI